MSFFEALVKALLAICAMALAFFLCVYVLGAVGFALPYRVEQILIVMFVLVAILILARLFYPFLQGTNFFPPRRPPGT